MRIVFALLLALGLSCAQAATINAASCSSAHVSTALASATTGDTVAIPSGSCTWTSAVSWTAPANVILQGAGTSAVGGGDVTVITDGYSSTSPLLYITTNASGTFRMTGITFQGGSVGSNVKFDGMISIYGQTQNFRADHIHMDATTYSSSNGALMQINDCTYGVIDHSIFDGDGVSNSIRVFNQGGCNSDALGVGDQAFALPTGLGTSKFIFAEDNVFNRGATNDCYNGGTFVWRHNVFNMDHVAPTIQTHPTAGTNNRHRGCKAWEIYGNTFNALSGEYISAAFYLSAGTGVMYSNTLPSSSASGGTGYAHVVTGHVSRYDNSTYPNNAPPDGWGYCSTHQTGTASAWDGGGSGGYPCLDQIGRGQGQLIVLDFPSAKNNVTSTVAWPNQALEPVYEWLSAYSPVPSNPSSIWSQNDPMAEEDRDFYLGTTHGGDPITFDGTVGVGSGILSARPATCTPLTAYWATNTSTLYQCATTNTWTTYYTPYTYPHPLVSGAAPNPKKRIRGRGQIVGLLNSGNARNG